jgi:hypothetical protein
MVDFNDVEKHKLQYLINYDTPLFFNSGDIVYLKYFNIRMIVDHIDMKYVYCKYNNEIIRYLPQLLVHYGYNNIYKFNDFVLSYN